MTLCLKVQHLFAGPSAQLLLCETKRLFFVLPAVTGKRLGFVALVLLFQIGSITCHFNFSGVAFCVII